jgi:predicted Zn-dependent peptidase
MYDVGGKDGDRERTGFAHFFEHLLFEGSKNIGRGEFMKLFLQMEEVLMQILLKTEHIIMRLFPQTSLNLVYG